MFEGNEEIYDNRGLGDKTREILKKNGVKSPSIEGKVEIRKGLWVVPNKIKDIEKLKNKYNQPRK